MIVEAAPAKINLALHVTGRRADGYHLLQSLVSFTRAGDVLRLAPAEADRLTIDGPFAADLPGPGDGQNLVERARDALRALAQARGLPAPPVALTLTKNLPVASGIGGGSADAAAALRGLARLWGMPRDALPALALPLGADVPMCLSARPLVASGIGETLAPVAMPALCLLLVNPLKPVATPVVFRALERRDNAPFALPATVADWPALIAGFRNDLEAPAIRVEPAIATVLAALSATGARLARMSGSGATCFALFDDAAGAEKAAATLRRAHPDWYIEATETAAGE